MTLIVNDKGTKCKLSIEKNGKIVFNKVGSMKSLLKFVLENTKQENVRLTILALKDTLPFMKGGLSKIEIKEE